LKRSNRLILLIGVLLAAVAFVGVIMISSGPGGGTTATPTPPPTTAKVVQAKLDIVAGTKLTAAMVQVVEVPIAAFTTDSIPDPGLAIGRRVFRSVSTGEQIGYSYFIESGAAVSVTDNIPKGLRAMAVQVDQVTGVGTLIHTGDNVDVIISIPIQITGADPANKNNVINLGVPGTSTKLVLQNLTVIGTLLPPPVANNAPPVAATPAPSGQVSAPEQPGTNLTGQNEVVIVAVTANQAEVIRWAQLETKSGGAQDRGTTSISVVLRSPKDYVALDASGSPVLDSNGIAVTVVPPLEKTDGVILKTLIEKYGVLPPEILIK
jgi:Flp pilus assembly protein CpaB